MSELKRPKKFLEEKGYTDFPVNSPYTVDDAVLVSEVMALYTKSLLDNFTKGFNIYEDFDGDKVVRISEVLAKIKELKGD